MEEDINICEEFINLSFLYGKLSFTKTQLYEYQTAIKNLITRYKEYDNLLGEIDNKEVSDALHMLLHCALKDTDFETQKQQFEIVNAYIKQLEEENKSKQKAYDDCYCEYKHYKQFDSIPKSKVKDKIEELDNERRKFTSDNVNNFYLQEFTRKYTQKSDHDYGVFGTPETITYCINNELLGRIEVLQDLLERSGEDV